MVNLLGSRKAILILLIAAGITLIATPPIHPLTGAGHAILSGLWLIKLSNSDENTEET